MSGRSNEDHQNGWDEYKQLILAEQRRFQVWMEKVSDDMSTIKAEIASLQTKSGVWGGLAGLVASLTVIVVAALAWMNKK